MGSTTRGGYLFRMRKGTRSCQGVAAIQECPFFHACNYFAELFRVRPAFARLYQSKYCLGGSRDCARYQAKQRLSLRPAQSLSDPDPDPGRDLVRTS
jgi:hypothetical protein